MKYSEERVRKAKTRIFEQIEMLLNDYDMQAITFGNIAKRCGCQPNSIAYYFKDKMDMLQQFIQDYVITADAELLPVLRAGLQELPPVERFCREIDCFFAVSDHKSKLRLLNNYFLITNSPLRSEFCEDLGRKCMLDTQNCLELLGSYRKFDILSEERFYDAYIELNFFISAFSVIHVFDIPLWNYQDILHNTKERLKEAFLKDSLYKAHLLDTSIPAGYPCVDMETAQNRYAPEGDGMSAVKREVYRAIERLLTANRAGDITFSKLAELCYCQPSGIAYYFKSKQDMLLQFIIHHVENEYADNHHPAASLPENTWTLENFCRAIHSLCGRNMFEESSLVFWINYILISNLASEPSYKDYYCFYVKRKYDDILEHIEHFHSAGILQEENIPQAFSELTMFCEGQSALMLFRSPIVEPERLRRTVSARLLRMFLKPEYHGEIERQ